MAIGAGKDGTAGLDGLIRRSQADLPGSVGSASGFEQRTLGHALSPESAQKARRPRADARGRPSRLSWLKLVDFKCCYSAVRSSAGWTKDAINAGDGAIARANAAGLVPAGQIRLLPSSAE